MKRIPQIMMRTVFLCMLVLFMASGANVVSTRAWAEDLSDEEYDILIPREIVAVRPADDGPPTEVQIGVFVVNLVDIDEAGESFRVDFVTTARWNDPRLAEENFGTSLAGHIFKLDEVWHPKLGLVNQRTLTKRHEDVVQIDSEGNVLYEQRLFGNMSAQFDLRRFPKDTQTLPIQLYSPYEYEVTLKTDYARTGFLKGDTLAGWTIREVEQDLHEVTLRITEENEIILLEFSIDVERQIGYFFWKLFLPLGFIVVMAWLVFWIDPANFGPQMGLSTASVFSMIAFLLSLGEMLPKIGYLTKADIFIVGCMFLVFGALIEAVAASRLCQNDRKELALTIDKHARWLYPLLFVVLIVLLCKY